MEEEHNIQRSLHYEIGNICRALEEEELSTAKDDSTVQISREAIAALTELTYQFSITSFANDLSSFSAHGNRSIINGKDVKLVLRKAPRRIREQFDKVCAENNVNCATITTGKEQKKGNTISSAFSKAPTDKNQYSSFNCNFEESSSDESDNSEIFSSMRANRRSKKFSSSSSSSTLDDSNASINDDDEDETKLRCNVGKGKDRALMSSGTEESSSIELDFSDRDKNVKRFSLQSIDHGGCIDLSSD